MAINQPAWLYPQDQSSTVVSKNAPNRSTSEKPPDWWNTPPSWYNPQAAGGGAAPQSTQGGPWGANWGTPPAAMGGQGPGVLGAQPGAAQGSLLGQINGMYGIDLATRYTTGNVIRIKDGNFYRVVGATEAVKGKEKKGLTKVKGRDGKYYYMKKLSEKEAKNVGKAPTPAPKAAGPAQNANRGFQQTDNWWTTDWWDRPGYYKRMY
jgi:hypothetical protein